MRMIHEYASRIDANLWNDIEKIKRTRLVWALCREIVCPVSCYCILTPRHQLVQTCDLGQTGSSICHYEDDENTI